MTGANRARAWPAGGARGGAACGDTLVVTKLDRLAQSLKDTRDSADELTLKGVRSSPGGSAYDPTDPVGRLLFNILGIVAEFEGDLIRMRTREGMAIARAKGKLKGKQPKLTRTHRGHLYEVLDSGAYSQTEIAELFNVSHATIYREVLRRVALAH